MLENRTFFVQIFMWTSGSFKKLRNLKLVSPASWNIYMETKKDEKYLGDIIMNDGKNTKNIKARSDKGEQIVTMFE